MEIRKLTKEEEGEILKISPSDINSRKDYYQNLVVNYFILNKRILANLFTRAGKSYLTLKAITRYRKKFQDKICIVAPSTSIIEDWKKLLISFENIEYYVINSYTIGDVKIDKRYGMFIVDELHTVLNKTSMFFSTTISSTEFDYFLGLSGTLGKYKFAFLEELGIKHSFEIPLKTGYKLGVVPEYMTYNIPVELTETEKYKYHKAQTDYNNQMEYFSKFTTQYTGYFIASIFKNKPLKFEEKIITRDQLIFLMCEKLQTNKGNIWVRAKIWNDAQKERNAILHNAFNKTKAVINFCKNVEGQVLVFTYKTDIADYISSQIEGSKALHSKIKPPKIGKKNKEDFVNKEFQTLVTCKSLNMGFTADLDYIVSIAFDSSVETSNQRAGRGMLLTKENPDKVVRIINFFVDDFEYNGTLISSQEKKWLEKSQFKQSFVEYIKSVNEIR